MKKRRTNEKETSHVKKTLSSACRAFNLPRAFRWNEFYANVCKTKSLKMLLKAEDYIPNNVELLFFLRFVKSNLTNDTFALFLQATSISFHRCSIDISHMGLYEIYPALIRLNYPVSHIPSMGYLWLKWCPETHLSLPKRLCAQVKSLLMYGIRHLPKDLRLRIVRTFVLLDYPFTCVGRVGDVEIVQTEDEKMKAAWALEDWKYFGKLHKVDVIAKFVNENQLEKMFYKLNMKLSDLKVDWYREVWPDMYRKLHPIACKLGYIGDAYIGNWFRWNTEDHLLHYNHVFQRETKMILLIFKKFPKRIQFMIIHFLSCLYGFENDLYVHYDRFDRWTVNDVYAICHPSLTTRPRSKEKAVQLFLKTQSFRNLLK
jgi:hypothetical protein